MANSEIKKSSRVRKNFYAVAKGHTTGIFTSWSLCSRSVDKFQGQIYKGFPDINSALDFLSPYSFKCTTTPVYDDLGKRKNVKEYQHTCCNCDTSLSTEIVNDQSENSRNHNINSVITSNSTSELIDSDTDSNISELECQDDLENTVISINTDNNNNTAPLKQHDDLQSQQTELKRVFQLAKTCCICHTQDDSSMITCNSCNKWIHYSCTNLPPYILFTLSSTQRKYTCRKCVVIPEDFIQKLENNKNASTTNASCQTSIDNQPDGSYLDSVASRFQESLVTSINTLNRDLPNRESDLTATIEKVNNIEQILKEKLATIITMLSHSNKERAQSDASLLEIGKKVKQTSLKLDQIQKDIKVLNSLQEPSLYELVEKSCMMIPIIKNATQDLPKDRKKMDGVVQQVQKLGNQIKTSSEEHQSKLEDIHGTMHALSENTTKPNYMYACKVQNKFELLENEKLCTNIDVEKVSDKICNSDENLCTNFNEKNEHNDTFTPVVNSPKGNTQNKNSVGTSPKGNTQNRISGQSSQTTKNPDHTRQSIDKQTNKRGSINKQNTQKKILLLGNSHLRPIRTNEFIRGYSQDIFCLQETHCDLDNCLELPNFQRPVHLIRPRTKPSGKRHGGLSVYILNTIRPGVKFLEHATNDFIWLKLDRTFFGFQEDLYICFVYNPPENSSYYRKLDYNILEMIENDIVKYSQSGKIMIAGDLNARTACEIDHIQMDSDKHIPLFDNYKCDSSLIQRKSKDSSINTRGRQLLSLCISSSLRILNGRTMGDLMGAHTCFQPLGCSVVDYFLPSEELLPNFTYFHTHNFLPDFSDHCQISCMLKCNTKIYERNLNLALMPDKYIWDDNSVSAFQDAINSNEIKNFIRQYKDKIYDQDSINNAAEDLNKIFLKAADLSLKKILRKPKKSKKKKIKKNREWQDQDIINLKQNLYRKYKLMQNHNTDPYIRGSFFKCLKSYRKQRRAKIRKFKQDIMNKLDNLYDQNPKAYWQLLDKIKNISNNSQNKSENTIDPSEWQEYFQKLNKNEQYSDDLIKKKLESFHNENVFNELDYLITPEEIEKAIKSLKNSKSSGFSMISNEMIKYSQTVCIPLIQKLFNLVFSSSIYPKLWGQGFITPLHKSGSKHDPSNYRGITIADNIVDYKMTVNIKKTKVLVFNKSGRLKNIKISLGNQTLECVQNYTYLEYFIAKQ
ncbi:uncharacterized protein [Mytilus edulis]|uniref:uncharacterized protein n=1 Tax=Mytilus edulis TaxID=6550 RepID=UPI0039F082E7